jgi:hypothetical protein
MSSTATLLSLESEWLVTAVPPLTLSETEPLSEVDEWLTQSSHWLGFSLRFDDVLDIQSIKKGLSKTLAHIPALGARVDTNTQDGLYQLVLSDEENQGVVLEYYTGTTNKDAKLPNDMDTRSAWKRASLDAPGPGFRGQASLRDPLMRARVVVFEQHNTSFLCVGINHGLCDGSGICDILQVWSHYCAHDSAKGLPELLNSPKMFGRRVTVPMGNPEIRTKQELYSRMEAHVGCTQDPFRLSTLLLSVAPRAIWCMSRQEELELRVSASQLWWLKQQVTAKLPPNEWVSSFQVLCASLLLVEFVTGDTTVSSHKLHVACNLRGRADRFPQDYFGNAAFDFCESLNDIPTEYNMDSLVAMVQLVHDAIQTRLKDPESICKTKDWFEAARHFGIKNKYDIWAPVVMDALSGEGTFVNAWDMRWMDVSMGSGQKATAMAAFFGVLQNLIIQVPRHAESGDSTIYLALPPAHAKRFRAFVQERKVELPFDIVDSTL